MQRELLLCRVRQPGQQSDSAGGCNIFTSAPRAAFFPLISIDLLDQ